MTIMVEGLEDTISFLSRFRGEINRALVTGLNRTRRGTVGPRGVITRFVRENYFIRARRVSQSISGRVNRRELKLTVKIEDQVIGIQNFRGRALRRNRRGETYSFQVRKTGGRKAFRHTFQLGNRTGPVFERHQGRIRRKFSTAVASTIRSNSDAIRAELRPLIQRNTEQALRDRLARLTGTR